MKNLINYWFEISVWTACGTSTMTKRKRREFSGPMHPKTPAKLKTHIVLHKVRDISRITTLEKLLIWIKLKAPPLPPQKKNSISAYYCNYTLLLKCKGSLKLFLGKTLDPKLLTVRSRHVCVNILLTSSLDASTQPPIWGCVNMPWEVN